MTTILTTKYTCDSCGNWRQVPVVLTRKGNGWVEVPPAPDRVVEPRGAA